MKGGGSGDEGVGWVFGGDGGGGEVGVYVYVYNEGQGDDSYK